MANVRSLLQELSYLKVSRWDFHQVNIDFYWTDIQINRTQTGTIPLYDK